MKKFDEEYLNKKYNNIIKKCKLDGGSTLVKPRFATDFSRDKKVKYIRDLNGIYIGNDRKKNKSIIKLGRDFFEF